MPTAAIAQQQYLPRLSSRNGLRTAGATTSRSSDRERPRCRPAAPRYAGRRRDVGARSCQAPGPDGEEALRPELQEDDDQREGDHLRHAAVESSGSGTPCSDADREGGDDGALELAEAAGDDHQERRDDVVVPSVGLVPAMSATATPPMPASPEPTKKVMPVDAAGRDADGLGEVAVLHGRPDLAAERGVLQQRREAPRGRRARATMVKIRRERPVVAEDGDVTVEPARR